MNAHGQLLAALLLAWLAPAGALASPTGAPAEAAPEGAAGPTGKPVRSRAKGASGSDSEQANSHRASPGVSREARRSAAKTSEDADGATTTRGLVPADRADGLERSPHNLRAIAGASMQPRTAREVREPVDLGEPSDPAARTERPPEPRATARRGEPVATQAPRGESGAARAQAMIGASGDIKSSGGKKTATIANKQAPNAAARDSAHQPTVTAHTSESDGTKENPEQPRTARTDARAGKQALEDKQERHARTDVPASPAPLAATGSVTNEQAERNKAFRRQLLQGTSGARTSAADNEGAKDALLNKLDL